MGKIAALDSGDLRLRFSDDGFLEIIDLKNAERLMRIPAGRMLLPQFASDAELSGVDATDGQWVLNFRAASLSAGRVTIVRENPGFSVQGEFTPNAAAELNRLAVCPAETQTSCYYIENYRDRRHTERLIPDVILGQKFATDTYSTDWQFAPHPTAALLSRNDAKLFWGATCAPEGGYGLYLSGEHYKFADFSLDYGGSGWGVKLSAGQTWKTPRFRIFLEHTDSPLAVWRRFGEILIAEKYIPDPAGRKIIPWHREQVYCTWLDQCGLMNYVPLAELQKQSKSQEQRRSWLPLTEKLVRESVEIIRREKLPFRTILIDGGWMRACGDFVADATRFPDMRRLVDDLHAAGFKVVVWWSWAEIRDEAGADAVGRKNLILDGKLNCHKRVMADYSKISTQEEYFKPTWRRMFSNEPGCYDFDGIKTDYQADKVHWDMPVENPAWRGEENYFQHLYELFYTEMRRWKPDAMHIGCAGNYFLAQYMDTNRTYDVSSDNHREHLERAQMLLATAPGVWPVMDMLPYRANMENLLRGAKENGFPVHIGMLRMIKPDIFGGYEPVTAEDFALWRKWL